MRSLAWLLGIVSAGSIGALSIAHDQPTVSVEGWGQSVDPDGDCRIQAGGGTLKIEVPGTKHDLTVETGSTNAPRVLRPIEGDFIVQVQVSGNIRHSGNRTSDRFLAYHGAGLLLWQDERTYIRLERAGVWSQDGSPDGKFVHYLLFEVRKDGKKSGDSSFEIPDQETFLRIERRGKRIYGLTSTDGVTWSSCTPIDVSLPKEVGVGVVAVSTSSEPMKVEFSGFEVFKKEPGPPGR